MMNSFLANIKFELNIRRKSISTYVYFLMFFCLSLLMGVVAGGGIQGAIVSFGISNKVFINSSVAITSFVSLLSAFSLFITAPAFGQAVVKDYAYQFDQIIYSTPIQRRLFLASRFVAALVFMSLVMSSVGLGLWVATMMPTVLKTVVTSNRFVAYALSYLVIMIPNIFIFGSIIFLIASKTKKMAPVYIAMILIFMGWMMSGQMLSEVENKMIASLADPFGINATSQTTKYWSADQQNTNLVGFEGYILYNRLLWGGLGLVCLLLSLSSFNFSPRLPKLKKKADKAPIAELKYNLPKSLTLSYSSLTMFWRQLRFEYKQVFKSIYFQTILLAGICYMFVAAQNVGKMYGTNTYPVTYMVLDLMGGSFDLFILIIVTFFAGEVVWRDRDQKTQQIIDSYPVPNGVLIAAKYFTLIGVVATLLSVVIVSGVIIQAYNGYTHFELPLYFKHLYGIRLFSYINLISLIFFLQVVTNNKYLAHGLTVAYYLFNIWSSPMGFEHKLYNFNSTTYLRYSDMNKYGHFLTNFLIFRFYWFTFAALLMVLAILFWQRGNLTDFKNRWLEFRRRCTPLAKGGLIACGLLFVGMASYIFYNTNVLNSYVTTKQSEKRQIDYEAKYSKYRYIPLPESQAVKAKVDIFPEKAAADLEYAYQMKNVTSKPIETLLVDLPDKYSPEITFDLTFSRNVQIDVDDRELGVRIYKFTPPLAVGESFEMIYKGRFAQIGIPNGDPVKQIVENGTFFNNSAFAVNLGYNPEREIKVNKTRAKYKLSNRQRMPDLNDAQARNLNALSGSESWIDFEATISTSPDQIAIAPGYLQKTWEENGRKYFHYKMDKKILNFYSFLSGRYKVKKDQWVSGKDVVNIEIYYHPEHEYNVDRMIDATKKTLDYFTKNFGPYQFTQYRVIEFPRYAGFAQSFPNTIPFSEAIGFVSHVRPEDPKDVDFPFFVTAHELAHQWWGHQVIPAGVQGAFLVTESFAEYTALLVMEKRYGHEKMKRFLREELETYLWGRRQENEYESPLVRSEGQTYIHYQKGSLALFTLKEYVGEDVLNAAIKDYLNKVKYQRAPFTIASEFVDIVKKHVPVAQHELVSDLLEKIVVFEHRPVSADYKKLADNKFEVRFKVNSEKMYSDKDGKETAAEFSQPFDVGVLNDKGDYLYLKKHTFKQGENEVVLVVDKMPAKVSVDPLNYIIDKTPDDNTLTLSEAAKESKKL